MSQSGVFLCPSCQTVIQSDQGVENGLTCTECGHEFFKRTAMPPPVRSNSAPAKSESVVRNVIGKRNPVAAQEAMVEAPAHEAPLVLRTEAPAMVKVEEGPGEVSGEIPEDRDEIIMSDGSRRVRRRKKKQKKEKNKALLIFLFVWVTVIGGVFYFLKSGGGDEKETVAEAADSESITAARNRLFVGEHFPRVFHTFKAFLNEFESGRRLQYIDQPSQHSMQFNRFYRVAVFPKPEGDVVPVARNVIEIKPEPNPVLGLETIWKDEDGHFLETVHVHDGEGWKIDWEAFAPYSTSPWLLFNSRAARSEGTFRLYVRKMKSLDESERIFVKFYPPPTFKEENKRRNSDGESPEVEIDSRSELGQQFIEMYQKHEAGEYLLGSMFPQRDPAGYMRVNVKLAWDVDEKDRPIMVLKEILGSSWYGQRIMDAQAEVEEESKGNPEEGAEEESGEGSDSENKQPILDLDE